MSIRVPVSLAAMLALSLSFAPGCDVPADDPGPDETEQPMEIGPFSVAATVHGATVDEVADALAGYIDEVDDTTRGVPSDWLVAGAGNLEPEQAVLEAALNLPGGSKVIEVCNHHYAEQAMAFGGHHGVALPCEIAVVEEDGAVDVVLLNPEAIFGVFFTDVPAEYAEQMGGLAATVRGELEELVADSLADHDAAFPREDVGPVWGEEQLAEFGAMPYSIEMDLDIPTAYLDTDEGPAEFQALFIDILLETLTYEGAEVVGAGVDGLSTDDWRAARPYALGLPGGVSVVEICSPTYAGAAMSTGAHHAPALPCQISIWVEGDVLRVHVLDPTFIFPVFFSDAPAEMMEQMGGLAAAVQQDILLMVDAARDETLL